jgi:hypothetical protein
MVAFFSNQVLLEPRSHVVTCPEVINSQANPACSQNDYSQNQLTNQTDRLLENIKHTPN